MKTKFPSLLLPVLLLLTACKPATSVATPTVVPLTPTSTPSSTPVPGNQVTFQTEDGVQIAATLYGTGEVAVILAHQGTPGADQSTWQQFATTLAENGFTAMTFDFRGVGQSGGVLDYALLDKDVRAAVQYLHDQGYNQIACVGASMGGTACLRVAIDDQPFIGLILLVSTMAAGPSNNLKILPEEMNTLTQPKLFITAKQDSTMVVRDTNRMYDLSPEPKELLLLDGYKHGTNLFQTEVGEELSRAMLEFLKALPLTTASPATASPLSGSGGGVIAFTSERDGNMDIYAMNADGSDQRPLTSDSRNDGWATWSPDGTQMAYHSVQGSTGILNILNIPDGSIQQLAIPLEGSLWEPAWSNDGNRIAFSNQPRSGESDIYVMDIDGTNLVRLTDAAGYDGGPYWSPDDQQIAFYSNRDGNFEVYVMNGDGTDQRRLTENPAEDLVTSWSPDGTRLAFFSDRDGNNELYVINADGSGLVRLTDNSASDREPAWSPDGTQIAFASDRDGNFEIYVTAAPEPGLPIDESTVRRLTDTPAGEMLPVWRIEQVLSLSYGKTTTTVPVGGPVILDGVFSPGEWDRALRQETTNGGEIFIMNDGDFLYLGIGGNFEGVMVTSVCLAHNNQVEILHSSASLGTAIFAIDDNNSQLTQPFNWGLYGVTSNTTQAESQRQAFFMANNWLANLGTMSETAQTEYQIALPDGTFHLGVGYLLPPNGEQAAWWPAGLADDCRKIELLQGNSGENPDSPLTLQFSPETWITVSPH